MKDAKQRFASANDASKPLNVVKLNFDMGNKNFRMYEIGKVFHIKEKATEDSSGVEEKRKLTGCIFGKSKQ